MNVYIIDNTNLVISINAKQARKHLVDVKQDRSYFDSDIKELRKLHKEELDSVIKYESPSYKSIGVDMETYLETKVGTDAELIEENYWSEN